MDLKEIVLSNESANSGKDIYLYEDNNIGAMKCFGYSAYYASRIVKEPIALFDKEVTLPCVMLRKADLEMLKMTCNVEMAKDNSCYGICHVQTSEVWDNEEYQEWTKLLKCRSNRINAIREKRKSNICIKLNREVSLLIGILLVFSVCAIIFLI